MRWYRKAGEIWMAHPFSAVPTPYRVKTSIPSMLGLDATSTPEGPNCTESIMLEFRAGELRQGHGVVHFAVPPSRFWHNVGFT